MVALPNKVLFDQTSSGGKKPEVSVVISLFNYSDFIVECLESVADQDLADIDLIVVDDCSTDASISVTLDWMQAHADRFGGMQLIKNVTNYGLSASRNIGIAAARSDLVFVMDADNLIFPSALRKLKNTLSFGNFAAAYSQLLLFGDERKVGYADFWSKSFLRGGPYIDAMALIRKEAWGKIGGYFHVEGGWEDYDLWCRFVENDLAAVFLPEILCQYRVHGQSMLRTDSIKRYDRIKNVMSLRHPWLDLE